MILLTFDTFFFFFRLLLVKYFRIENVGMEEVGGRSDFWFEMWSDPIHLERVQELLLKVVEEEGEEQEETTKLKEEKKIRACRHSLDQVQELIQIGSKLVLEKKVVLHEEM